MAEFMTDPSIPSMFFHGFDAQSVDEDEDEGVINYTNAVRESLAASTYSTDDDQIALLEGLPHASFDFVFFRDPPGNLPWWTVKEQARRADTLFLRYPLFRHILDDPDYETFRSQFVLAASALVAIRPLLKSTGNLIIQCNPEVDDLYRGITRKVYPKEFREVIAWHRGMHSATLVINGFVNNKDHLLRFEMPEAVFNPVYRPVTDAYSKKYKPIPDGALKGEFARKNQLTGGNWGKIIPWTSPVNGRVYTPTRPWAIPRLHIPIPKELHGETLKELDWLDNNGWIVHSPNLQAREPAYWSLAKDTIHRGKTIGDIWAAQPGTKLHNTKKYIDEDVRNIGGCLRRFLEATTTGPARVLFPFCNQRELVVTACEMGVEWRAMGHSSLDVSDLREKLGDSWTPKMSLWTPTTMFEAKKLRDVDGPLYSECQRVANEWFRRSIGAIQIPRPWDRGVDGQFTLRRDRTLKIFTQVKSGKWTLENLRSLHSAMQIEKADLGVLICWGSDKLTKEMREHIRKVNLEKGGQHGLQVISLARLLPSDNPSPVLLPEPSGHTARTGVDSATCGMKSSTETVLHG
jgi:hypothetical protein